MNGTVCSEIKYLRRKENSSPSFDLANFLLEPLRVSSTVCFWLQSKPQSTCISHLLVLVTKEELGATQMPTNGKGKKSKRYLKTPNIQHISSIPTLELRM